MEEMDMNLNALLWAVERAGFIVVTDRKGRAVICTVAGEYVARLREMLPGQYAPPVEARSPSS